MSDVNGSVASHPLSIHEPSNLSAIEGGSERERMRQGGGGGVSGGKGDENLFPG